MAQVHQPAGDEELEDDHTTELDCHFVDNKMHAETVKFGVTLRLKRSRLKRPRLKRPRLNRSRLKRPRLKRSRLIRPGLKGTKLNCQVLCNT